MQVEVIEFNGIKFRRYPKSDRMELRRYYTPSGHYRKRGVLRLHQEIWKSVYGEIPEGHHIHHKDGNTLNNSIENLECILESEHLSHHGQWTGSDAEHMARIRPLAAEWHSSEEGREFSRKNWSGSLGKWMEEAKTTRKCDFCRREYETPFPERSRFCSNRCKSAQRRADKKDQEKRICLVCGKEFSTNKYSKAKTCSKDCGARSRFLPGGDRHGLQPRS